MVAERLASVPSVVKATVTTEPAFASAVLLSLLLMLAAEMTGATVSSVTVLASVTAALVPTLPAASVAVMEKATAPSPSEPVSVADAV